MEVAVSGQAKPFARRILEAFESAFAGSMSEEQFARLESVRRRITPVVQATPPGPR